MRMRWFRMYSAALDDRKVQQLQEGDFKGWVNLMCLASEQEERGRLPPVDDCAFRLRIETEAAEGLLTRLGSAGLVDQDDAGGWALHNWSKWQPPSDNAADRMANKRRTGSEHVRPRKDEEEKRIEVDTEKDEEEIGAVRRNIFVLFDNFMGKPSITATIRDLLLEAEGLHSPECVEHCFVEAASSSDGRRSWAFVAKILKRHQEEGCNGERRVQGSRRSTPVATADQLDRFEKRYALQP